MPGPRGFKLVQVRIAREHVEAARAVLTTHRCVEQGATKYEGEQLHFYIDRCLVPADDIDCVAGVIARAVEGARP